MPAAARTRRKPDPQQELPLPWAEGVHVRLPDHMHHEAPAIGASDFHVLATDPPSWWYSSSFNTERREALRKSRALTFGSALHALILEGEAAYESRFIVEPDRDSNRYAKTREAILLLLEAVGYKNIPRGSASFDMAELHKHARRAGVADRIWDLVNSHYLKAKSQGRAYVTEDENRRLRRMAHLVAQHPDLGPNLRKGLSEVSVFWRKPERPEILLRARFDKLLPGVAIDLKTFANTRDESPEDATFESIVSQGYDLQAEHYREAHRKLCEFVKAGQIHFWDFEGGQLTRVAAAQSERDTLTSIANAPTYQWLWIFYQVQSDDAGRERAPIVVPWWVDPADAAYASMFDDARRWIDRAIDNYSTWKSRCGLTQAWSEVRPGRPLPPEKLKRLQYKRNQQ
jgi:hypothetical protein